MFLFVSLPGCWTTWCVTTAQSDGGASLLRFWRQHCAVLSLWPVWKTTSCTVWSCWAEVSCWAVKMNFSTGLFHFNNNTDNIFWTRIASFMSALHWVDFVLLVVCYFVATTALGQPDGRVAANPNFLNYIKFISKNLNTFLPVDTGWFFIRKWF